ncbi:hypothetical protein A3D11_03890 [Candidatus Peribacteria bacterium RIFCSPHIGHO2_02_FULL_49_16]|nr:MAG: hypothetical protein A2880_04850 [Candidatus Peribacteria bacterium RIFCSPHIGHO2_01_FULL_49_38]OGJ58874.1 MAG: hypothetical protein A3D11_03890 [Candidatus Peribacteria bacterium RIFCSPHIGHO2_02_FULL_49_16]
MIRYTCGMEKPKVVILSTFLSPLRSGAEACAEEVALGLSDRYEVTVVTAKMRRDLEREAISGKREAPVRIIRVGFGCMFDKWLYPFLASRVAKSLKPDIIHAVLETFAGLALYRCRKAVPEAKRILTLQTTNRKFLKKRIVQSADKVTAISSVLVRIAKEYERDDVISIPNGIHLEAIQRAIKEVKKIFGRILFVGRLEPMKGVDTLLHTFALIRKEFPHASLHIVGDGSERTRLKFLSEKLLIVDSITFTGRMDPPNLYREFAEAEVFCGLSRSEALGNVFLEAQAAGCVVIATRIGGISDIVKSGETGILVSPNNPQEAADAIKEVLYGEKLRMRMTEAGMQNAQKYDWSVIVEKYKRVYEEMMKQ